jgi:hypothetical protein
VESCCAVDFVCTYVPLSICIDLFCSLLYNFAFALNGGQICFWFCAVRETRDALVSTISKNSMAVRGTYNTAGRKLAISMYDG